MKNILFVTWDGPQVFYTESLFAPIFVKLKDHGYEVFILQFTWGTDERIAQIAHKCAEWGLSFKAVTIQRRWGPAGPFLSAIRGRKIVRRLVDLWGIDIVMPRSLMAGLVCLAAGRVPGVHEVFDADGLAADERVDVRGESRSSPIYRLLRTIERRLTRRADLVLTRSGAASVILARRAGLPNTGRFRVVKNGRDEDEFSPDRANAKASPAPQDDGWSPRLVYAGSLGKQYRAPEMLRIAGAIHDRFPGTTFHIMTGSTEIAGDLVRERFGERPGWITIEQVPPNRVAPALADGDFAFALRTTSFSSKGIAPIKVGEYLLSGVPVIGTPGVGDVAGLDDADAWFSYTGDPAPVVDWVEATRWRFDAVRRACRREGVERFSLNAAVASYVAALASLSDIGAERVG